MLAPSQQIELAKHPREHEPEPLDIPSACHPWAMTSSDYTFPYQSRSREIDGDRYGTPPADDAARLAAIRRQAKVGSRPRNRRR
jgi:hypothetical protein